MPVTASTLTGARVKLYINQKLAGVFTSCSWGVTLDTAPMFILGRYNAAEIVYTGMDVVEINVGGFRVLRNGPHEIGSVPHLKDLLNHQEISLQLVDRQSGDTVMNVINVRPVSYASETSARGVQSLNIRFQGTQVMDESLPSDEDVGAVRYNWPWIDCRPPFAALPPN